MQIHKKWKNKLYDAKYKFQIKNLILKAKTSLTLQMSSFSVSTLGMQRVVEMEKATATKHQQKINIRYL
jgi:hypothetical protein